MSLLFLAGCGGSATQPSGSPSGGTNPVPTVNSLSPNSAVVGGADFTLTVNGANFVSGSVVNFAGTARSTTFVSATQLISAIPAAAISSAGTAAVTVFNLAPGGGTSNAMNFTINAPSLGSFTPTGSMTTPRSSHTATLLPDGRVLITGGTTSLTAELYTPSERTFTSSGTMTTARSGHTATLLGDGRILITGGSRETTRAELYDPKTGTFTATGEVHQFWGTATLLHSGQVLIAGGVIDPTVSPATVANPELYDPTTGAFTLTGPFQSKGGCFYVTGGPCVSAATLLPDGRVLIAGEPDSELYDPVTGTFSLTGTMTTPCFSLGSRPSYISGRTATLLMTGKVLVAGGEHEDCGRFANAELYDARAGTFAATGSMTRVRDNHTATLLPDGTVLIAGGETEDCDRGGCVFSGTTTSAESYVPSTGTFVTVSEMTARRAGQSATLLNDGTVLIAGGYCYAGIGQFCGAFASAEIYKPATVQ